MILNKIIVYPVKSLDGVSVREARITAGGILEHDRIYGLFDDQGKYVNGKRTAQIQRLRTEFDPEFREIALSIPEAGGRHQFSLAEPAALNCWLSDFFGFSVHLEVEPLGGFPDDRAAPGPTLCSEASLDAVAAWFPGLSLDSARRRFRTNLEVSGTVAFEEDRLFGLPEERTGFCVGDVQFFGHNPCQRCVVPTRDPDSIETTSGFQKRFMEMRQKTLPPWSQPSRFNHYYRFAVNTSIPSTEQDKVLRVGETVQLNA